MPSELRADELERQLVYQNAVTSYASISHEDYVNISSGNSEIDISVHEAEDAICDGIQPSRIPKGSSGSYFVLSRNRVIVAPCWSICTA